MKAAAIAAVFLSVAGVGTAFAGPQFTADAVETEPGRDMKYVRMFVGEKGSRFEYQAAGQPVVEIVLPAEGKVLTLFPLTRTYAEGKGAPFADLHPSAPCEPSNEVECKMEAGGAAAGGSQTPGAKIERWVAVRKGLPGEERVWWDAQRKMAVRQEFADGREMQATMRGTMSFDNRSVENWEFLYLTPNGMYRRGVTLFAPDLGYAVAEQQPGGLVRELRNIQPGAPDAKLLEVPEGYQKIDTTPPAAPAAAPAQLLSGGAAQPGAGTRPAQQAMAAPPAPGQAMGPQGTMAPMTMPQMVMPAPQTQPLQYGMPAPAAPAARMMPPMTMPATPRAASQVQQAAPAPQTSWPLAGAQQGQPMMPPPYAAPWIVQTEASKGGSNAAGPPAQPAGPPLAPSPTMQPPFGPYAWQPAGGPQFQRPDQQTPASEFGRKP